MEDTQIRTVDLFRTPAKDELTWEDLEGDRKKDDMKSAFRGLFTPSILGDVQELSPELNNTFEEDLQVVPQFASTKAEDTLEEFSSHSEDAFGTGDSAVLITEKTEPTIKVEVKPSAESLARKRKVEFQKAEYERLHKKKMREAAIIRFRQKKEEKRNGVHQVRYECRKRIADSRPRVKGRFVRKGELHEVAVDPLSYLQ
mmetsp:Transcript_11252/g.34450  ORF Transcript_11252/g.34450 Transcript_11252/m.34450 type:complete len:200 (-) Transcript_11252:74-673(-)|eukprot:CAMPEP_0198733696 /NCGR_PEP_ID=MMETSP1475-20131203/47607_1 /TAXON_ID= ORGANISM="Unidentified sp., Strain CCMP1999" /NCGR_SAMPLE_ID=MMETSP1475 /ASSEMBLY_ACC=CAM_ASM_001111 /LENGTH=199 /DNA_ID=CAMNT_0044497033 /DNA_START=56 /DNA_END=655 /DNA_ORIENTATION=-